MRYSIISKGMPVSQIEAECRALGAKDVNVISALKQVFCDLEPEAADKLRAIPGLAVKETKEMRLSDMVVPEDTLSTYQSLQSVYAASQGSLFTLLYNLRAAFAPPILGSVATAVVIDTGIRSTHRSLRGKIVYAENFSDSDTAEDIFDHGTGVAYLIAGGVHAAGQESGVAPGANLMNLKAIDDEGNGTNESVILALDKALALWQDAENKGLSIDDPMYPNIINMSVGSEDDGDPDDPIRLACREIYAKAGNKLLLYAAAGNAGPNPGTILLPAACEEVWAVGALTFEPFQIWPYSSRGPVAVGNLVKPDGVCPAVDILTASGIGDDAFVVKTGTSFACPIGVGSICLLGEMSQRYGMVEQMLAMTRPDWELFAMLVSRKPEGAPVPKDNDYGLGMPMGDLVLRRFGVTAGVDSSSMFNAVLGAGMIGAMMPAMIKAVG